MSEKTKVFYSDFGAVGDGVTDDFAALRAAHDYANEHRLPVFADAGKNYYIGNNGAEFITVKTSTDWTGATITVDDSVVAYDDPARTTEIFRIAPEHDTVRHEADSEVVRAIVEGGGLKTDTKKIAYKPGQSVMLIPYDTEHKVYIRYGGNANNGSAQHEVIIVDAEGNIDPDTPILISYDNISYILEKRIDDEPITLTGGTYVTVANCAPCNYTYYKRNIVISRSNVTVRGLTHKRVKEGERGAPYAGFITASELNDLRVEECVFQAHRFYEEERVRDGEGNVVTWGTSMGTYEIGGGSTNKVVYYKCTQSNFYDKDGNPTTLWFDGDGNTALNNKGKPARLWGVMGTNYCKNISYDSCVLNRLDAHAGVYNASVINSEIVMINLIGGGTALFKDSTVYSPNMITLRGDYGSTWHGDVIIENVKWVSSNETPYILSGVFYNHYFGYPTYLPSVTIDGLEIVAPRADKAYVFSAYSLPDCADPTAARIDLGEGAVENKNPMVFPECIRITGKGVSIPVYASHEGSAIARAIKIIKE